MARNAHRRAEGPSARTVDSAATLTGTLGYCASVTTASDVRERKPAAVPSHLEQVAADALRRSELSVGGQRVAYPIPSSTGVSRRMALQPSRNTKAELRIRSELHRAGLRFRIHQRPVRAVSRAADVVLPTARVAVFVDGCWWHGCPEHYRPARKNASYWSLKIERNRARDLETDLLLANAGWVSVRVWDHEDSTEAAQRVIRLTRGRLGALQALGPGSAVGRG